MSDDIYDSDTEQGEVRWVNLTPTDRRDMMQFVFEDDDWYDGAGKYYEGGNSHPRFDLVAKKTGAPVKEVKRYYNAFLKKHGHDGKDVFTKEVTRTVVEPTSSMPAPSAPQPTQSMMNPQQGMSMPSMDFNEPDPMESILQSQMQQQGQKGGDGIGMVAMMGFLTSQQRLMMQQQQFQMQMMMEQRKSDQFREMEMRREQMARDQQFMSQQTTLLKETMKKANDSGLGGKLQAAYEEKMIDEIVNGGRNDGWRDDVKDILTSDTLKEAVTGLGSALTSRAPQVPVGYDAPNYNPYAQPVAPQPVAAPVQQLPPQPVPQTVQNPPQDGVFFEEQPAQPIAQQQPPAEMTASQYREILLESFSQLLGPSMQDEQVAKAVNEQIEVAVDITLLEMPEALPQIKLQSMSEKLLLVRNLRDICFGLRDLRERVSPGEAPGAIIMSAVTSELKKRPEFYNIFATNTYEELIAQIDPFKETGAVKYDYEYLLRPEVAEIARYLLAAVAQDAQSA